MNARDSFAVKIVREPPYQEIRLPLECAGITALAL
jgi:hypothetical protein